MASGKEETSSSFLSPDTHTSSSSLPLTPVPLTSSSSSNIAGNMAEKDEEIEHLHAECLELEEVINGLKKEVAEAWSTYQTSQEKAALRESELADEIKALKQAKQTDKTQFAAQMSALEATNKELVEQNNTLKTQMTMLRSSYAEKDIAYRTWQQRERVK